MKAYITKWAITKGIIDVDDPEMYKEYLCIGPLHDSINAVDWFKTKPAAIERAEEMRVNKIASLRKQIVKLEIPLQQLFNRLTAPSLERGEGV